MGKGSGKGGSVGGEYHVRGGHAASIAPSPVYTFVESPPVGPNAGPTRSSYYSSDASSRCAPAPPQCMPKGLKNVGNTCYANAVLQCLLSTALTHALVDPKASAIFRRYSSNPVLLEQGSGSVDSSEEATPENSETGVSSASRISRSQKRIREREQREMLGNSRWLTRELKAITLEYHRDTSDSMTSMQYPSSPSSSSSFTDWFMSLKSRNATVRVVDPGSITRCPDRLSKCLRPYQQEDAHEFLRALLGTLVMNGQNKKLSSLFDGLLESAVTCHTCRRPSLTRDRYMDLSLDINEDHIHTLTDALEEFTKTETLSGDNKFFCQQCGTKRTASKGLRLATAPSILVCHMKRFAFDRYGRLVRLHKHVQFPLRLEIGDFMSRVNKARPPPYELVSVLVHQGRTCDSGHYVAFVKTGGNWFKCNDSLIEQVNVETVLQQQAYLLVYEVAGMRENHGYPSPNQFFRVKRFNATGSVSSAADSRTGNLHSSPQQQTELHKSLFGPSLWCGVDSSVFADLCCTLSVGRKPVVVEHTAVTRYWEQSWDDSTMGGSTVESCETDVTPAVPLRRSSSSGHIKSTSRKTHLRKHSAPVAQPSPQTGTSEPGYREERTEKYESAANKLWSSEQFAQHRERPPRPMGTKSDNQHRSRRQNQLYRPQLMHHHSINSSSMTDIVGVAAGSATVEESSHRRTSVVTTTGTQ